MSHCNESPGCGRCPVCVCARESKEQAARIMALPDEPVEQQDDTVVQDASPGKARLKFQITAEVEIPKDMTLEQLQIQVCGRLRTSTLFTVLGEVYMQAWPQHNGSKRRRR